MWKFIEVARTGLDSVYLYPARNLATVAAVLAVLLPYLAALGISHGVQRQADLSVRVGADLYVSGIQFGRQVPVPLEAGSQLASIPGVTSVVPRIVGSIRLGKNDEAAVLVGMPVEHFATKVQCVDGRLPRPGSRNELVVGSELASRLNLKVGSMIPPFYRNSKGERLSEVVGVFRSDVPLWQSRMLLTTIETAAAIFDQPGLVSGFMVDCQKGYEAHVSAQIQRRFHAGGNDSTAAIRPKVTAREELSALLSSGMMRREGVFNLHYTLAFGAAILVVLVTSGFGLAERRREIGILKATGWQTDEILLRGLVESVMLSVSSAALAVVVSYVWLRWFNGLGIASVFLADVNVVPEFRVPFRLAPIPTLLAFLIALVMVTTGTLYCSWRAATTPPVEAMR